VRILVLFAHPVETSFGAALHAKLVEVLRARGHKVDDCDLNAEGFDPVMSRQDRIDYHNVAVNRARVAPYVDRLLAAEALVFSFPVWNMGFPAILWDSSTRSSCPASASPSARTAPTIRACTTSNVSGSCAPMAAGGCSRS